MHTLQYAPMDTIFIRECRVEAWVGIYEWETQRAQTLELDIEIGDAVVGEAIDRVGRDGQHGQLGLGGQGGQGAGGTGGSGDGSGGEASSEPSPSPTIAPPDCIEETGAGQPQAAPGAEATP